MSAMRARMSHAPRRISSKRVGSKLYSSTGPPDDRVEADVGQLLALEHPRLAAVGAFDDARRARRRTSPGGGPRTRRGGSTMWSSTEIMVKRRSARSGSGSHETSPAVAVVKPCFACSSSSGMATATPTPRARRAPARGTTPCQYTGAARSISDALSCFWCVGAIGIGLRSIARTSQCSMHVRSNSTDL